MATDIHPSTTYCTSCAVDTAPDQFGRTWPYAVFTDRTVARNFPHTEAHLYADSLRAAGFNARVGFDTCG